MGANPQQTMLMQPTPRPGAHTAWDAANKSATITLSNSNRTAAGASFNFSGVRSNNPKLFASGGQYYFEITCNSSFADARSWLGFQDDQSSLSSFDGTHSAKFTENGSNMVCGNPALVPNIGAYVSKIVGVAVDFTAKLWWVSYDGVAWNAVSTANPATGAGGQNMSLSPQTLFSGTSGNIWIAGGIIDTGASMTLNCGNEVGGFARTPPAGFGPWDT